MTNHASGHAAEQVAAEYLSGLGYKIRALNWKTRYCEIDIVAEKDEVMHFVEVKSRASRTQGSGLEYITPKKLQQMSFAAEMWVAEHAWIGDYRLAAVAIDAQNITFLDSLT